MLQHVLQPRVIPHQQLATQLGEPVCKLQQEHISRQRTLQTGPQTAAYGQLELWGARLLLLTRITPLQPAGLGCCLKVACSSAKCDSGAVSPRCA